MAGCRLFLTFEGVDCAFYAWLNGTPLGFSKDSRLPAEFEVTAALRAGANTLAVQVRRRGAARRGACGAARRRAGDACSVAAARAQVEAAVDAALLRRLEQEALRARGAGAALV
jgi:hypothetical protein